MECKIKDFFLVYGDYGMQKGELNSKKKAEVVASLLADKVTNSSPQDNNSTTHDFNMLRGRYMAVKRVINRCIHTNKYVYL